MLFVAGCGEHEIRWYYAHLLNLDIVRLVRRLHVCCRSWYLPILRRFLIGLGHLIQTKTLTLSLVSNEYENEFVIDNVIGYLHIANQKTR